ncbi:Hint domain-containing protein [Sedimentibacter sp.]|uniref:Hint domain-containing protein n=1 Tax=Sedimentibacter sp. TaxID=1960295 RepID=UPI0028B05031|nr:Hint domain-containing protein [Sedimentibacter sp.]
MKNTEYKTLYKSDSCCRFGCMGKDTEIFAADGMTKKADRVSIGDKLISRGGKTVVVMNIMTGLERQMVSISTKSGSVLLTGDHIVATTDGNRTAGNIRPGDMLWSLNTVSWQEEPVRVERVEWVMYDDKVYNFVFEEAAFVVGNGLFIGDFTLQQTESMMKLPLSDKEADDIRGLAEKI